MIIKGKRKDLEKKVSRLISENLTRVVKDKGKAVLAIPGGTSVKGIFELLKHEDIPWENVHIFIVDERLVPIDNEESNYKLAFNSFIKELLAKKKIPADNIHPFIYTENIKKDLTKYEKELKSVQGYFDLVLLSAGEDGHVAGLFPNHETVISEEAFFISTDKSPKPPMNRLSSSRRLLLKSKIAILLFFGASKENAFEKFEDANLKIEDCPAKIVKQVKKNHVLVDLT